MALVLDISTSMEFWRQIYPANRMPSAPSCELPSECTSTLSGIETLAPAWVTERFLEPLDGRIHVMSFDSTTRRNSKRHVLHNYSGTVPPQSFYELESKTFIAAPAFIFLVAATLLSTTQLIAFGCELCGKYRFDKRETRGFRANTTPLLSIEQLRRYLSQAEGCRGHRKALAALPYVIENSASPMETFDALALCLPCRLGGYALEKPLMNHEVTLSNRAARIAKRKSCFPDMCYLEAHLDIEHHGKLDHSSPDDQASDRARVNALKEMGFEVIELTSDQVRDSMAFEYIVQRIAKLLGKRLRTETLGATSARLTFRQEMLDWNRSFGRLR